MKKKLLIFVGILISILLIGVFVLNSYLDKYLKNEIVTSINQSQQSPYKISIQKVKVNVFPPKVRLQEIFIYTDTLLAEQTDKPKTDIKIDEVLLRGVSIWNYISKGEWKADNISLKNPLVNIKYVADSTQGVSQAADTVANFVVAPLAVRKLEVENLSVKYQYNSKSSIALKKLDLKIEEARWLRPPTFRFSSEKIQVSLENLFHKTSQLTQEVDTLRGTLYQVSFDTAYTDVLRFSDASLLISNYVMQHQNGTDFKIKQVDYQNQVVMVRDVELSQDLDEERKMRAKHLEAHHLNWQSLQRQLIEADKILIYSPDISILKDRNRHPKPPAKKMPYQWKIGLAIDTLEIREGNIVYSERSEGLEGIGNLNFDSLNMIATNFHNFEESEPTLIKADMYFMKESRIEIAMEMPLNGDTFEGKLKGSCSQIAFPSLNKMIAPLVRFEASRGTIEKAWFDAQIKDGHAQGTFYITYDGLEMALLKRNSNKKRKFLSGLLNTVIDKKAQAKEGDINYHREYNDSLLRYVWRVIRSGLINSMLP